MIERWKPPAIVDEPMDSADFGQAREELDRAVALHEHRRRVQVLEDQAIDADGVVWCLDCDEPVGVARLALVPHAVRCVDCEAARERRERQWS